MYTWNQIQNCHDNAACNKKKAFFTNKVGLNLRKKLVQCYIWCIALYCAELGQFRKLIGNTCKVFYCGAGEGWRRSLYRSCEKLRSITESQGWQEYATKRRKASWIGHILRGNCFLKRVFEGKIEGAGRRGIRRKQLLDDRKEQTGYCNWKVTDRTLENSLWKRLWTCRKTSEWMKTLKNLGIVDIKVYCFDCSSYIFGTMTKTDCQRYINSPIPVGPNIIVQCLLNRHPRVMRKRSASWVGYTQ